jgi:hypothetical protein
VRRRSLETHGGALRGNAGRAVAARTLSDEGDDPGLTNRVGPPVSEREVTGESNKQREAELDKRSRPAVSDKWSRPGSLTGWAHLSVRGRRRPNRTSSEREATGRLGRTGREEMGRGWARKEERRPSRNYFLG